MTEPTEATPPPLPTLTNATPDPVTTPNEWRVLLESVALHAETPRFVPGKTLGSALRSPFRTGTICLSDAGIEIEGMAMLLPPRWYPVVAMLSMVPFVSWQLFNVLAPMIGLPIGTRIVSLFFALPFLFSRMILQRWLNKRRAETKTVIGWESVRGLQVDHRLRFVTLVFSSVSVPAKPVVLHLFGKKPEPLPALPHSEFVTLNKLEPPIVAGFAATVEHYAPHVRRENAGLVNPVAHWLTIILISVVGVGLFVFLVSVFFAVQRMQRSIP